MKKKILFTLIAVCTMLFAFGIANVSAATTGTYGDLTYKVSDGEVTITDCSETVITVEVPNTIDGYPVTSIGADAFSYCFNLTSITIPDSVTSIGESAFYWCNNLTSINVDSNNLKYCDIDGTLFAKDRKTLIQYAIGKTSTSYIIPDSVTSIGGSAFSGCNLTSITIPDGVTSIGAGAFSGCHRLKNVYITDLEAWCNIKFTNSGSNPLSPAKANLYLNDKILANLTFPDSITTINDYAFCGCDSIVKVTIPDSVTSIGVDAFSYCGKLISITIPDGVTSIGLGAFRYCENLTSITIPDSVTSIGPYAFYDCQNLTSITIPDSVTNIGIDAFYGCRNLKSVNYIGSEEDYNMISIEDGNNYFKNAVVTFILPATKTTVSVDGKTFTVIPSYIENGNIVILALYNGDMFVELHKATYTGEELEPFIVTETYTNAKVFVWSSFDTLIPIADAEIVDLNK